MNYEEILFLNQVPTALLDFLKKNPDNWLTALRSDHFESSLKHYLISA